MSRSANSATGPGKQVSRCGRSARSGPELRSLVGSCGTPSMSSRTGAGASCSGANRAGNPASTALATGSGSRGHADGSLAGRSVAASAMTPRLCRS